MSLSTAAEDFVKKYNELVGGVSLGGFQAPVLTTPPTAKGGTAVSLAWTYPTELQNALTGFEITRVDGSGAVLDIPAPGKTTTATTDSLVVSGATYRYRVRAVGTDRKSFFSAEASVTV
jgi:hypothetical protein